MRDGAGYAIVLALLLVSAGCVAPANDGTDGADGGIDVEGAGLPVDPDLVFDRVTDLTGADPPRPGSIRVVTPSEDPQNGSAGGIDPVPAFFERMDVDSDADEGLNRSEALELENGMTNLGVGTVTLFAGDNDSETVEYVLAHEFVHYVQAARDRPAGLLSELGTTTDAVFVAASLLEGSAVFATNAYIEEHMAANLTNSGLYFDLRERLAGGSYPDYANSRYIVGWRYVSGRLSSPAAFDRLYADPPRTSEQVIHGLDPGEEPPRPLSVSVDAGSYRHVDTDRLGEGFIRVALRNGLSRSRAASAAAGWGNDTLRTYLPESGGDPSYAWTVRFDDAHDRTAFVDALRASLDARGFRSGGTWTVANASVSFGVRTVGETSVVVLVGTESFVSATSVSGGGRAVSIALPEYGSD